MNILQKKNRSYGRAYNQVRPIIVTYNQFGYAAGSVLLEMGNTKILCSVSLQNNVPSFLKGKKKGWLTAEYAMLPTATHSRRQRESSGCKKNGRSIEISRLIGRSLRTVVNTNVIGERTIVVDCDVLQADGGTRTACIGAAYLALQEAEKKWIAHGTIPQSIIIDGIAAISVGIADGQPLLDLDYSEDSKTDADYNFVLTSSNSIIEIQGTAEQAPLSWQEFQQLSQLAQEGVAQLFEVFKKYSDNNQNYVSKKENSAIASNIKKERTPLFSLQNRQNIVP